MKKIKLTHEKYAIVDDNTYEYLNQFKWHALHNGATWYAARDISRDKTMYMHREIMGAPDGSLVDHKNGDGLDNRRKNLRICTNAQNSHNRGKPRNNTTGFKGVSRARGRKKGRAQIFLNGHRHRIHLGTYTDPQEAARVYDRAARKFHGEFARTNF